MCDRNNIGGTQMVATQSDISIYNEVQAKMTFPILAYVFILCLEILFALIKKVSNTKGAEIFGYCYL